MMMKNFLFTVLFGMLLVACSKFSEKEIDRMSFEGLSNDSLNLKTFSINLDKDDEVTFWNEMELSYEGEVDLKYIVEVWKDSVKLGGFEMNALETNPTSISFSTASNNNSYRRFEGEMNFLIINEKGNYTFKAVITSNKDAALMFNQINLILKK